MEQFSKIQYGKYLTVNQLNKDITELYNLIMKDDFEYKTEPGISEVFKALIKPRGKGSKPNKSNKDNESNKSKPKNVNETDEDDDILLAIISLIMNDTTQVSLDKQFRRKIINKYDMYKRIKSDQIKDKQFIIAILNQTLSFLVLSVYLNKENKMCYSTIDENEFQQAFPGIEFIQNSVSIGTGNAIKQWNDDKLSQTSYFNISSLKFILNEFYKKKVVNLGTGIAGYIGSTQIGDNAYGENCAHIWGANIDNFNLDDNTEISGSGQATAFVKDGKSKQSPGVFGIISTNNNMKSDYSNELTRALEIRKWPNIDVEYYIIFYGVLRTICKCYIPIKKYQIMQL